MKAVEITEAIKSTLGQSPLGKSSPPPKVLNQASNQKPAESRKLDDSLPQGDISSD